MSYEIVKSIKIKDNKVFITSDSNNVYPKYFHEWECNSLTKIFQEKGQNELDYEIMKTYESGCFQSYSGKYSRAVKVLIRMPEYKNFNWRLGGIGPEYNEICKNRKENPMFKELLLRALKTKLPKTKFILSKQYSNSDTKTYLYKITKKYIKWTYYKNKAKIFRFKDEVDSIKGYFTNSEYFQTEQIK